MVGFFIISIPKFVNSNKMSSPIFCKYEKYFEMSSANTTEHLLV